MMTRYRDRVPLSERDYAAVRAAVRAKVRKRAVPVWRFALAAAVVVFVIVFWPRRIVRITPVSHKQIVATVVPRPIPQAPRNARGDIGGGVHREEQHHHHRTRHAPHAQVAAAEPVVIQLQTSNPDVRIIWIGGTQ